MFPNSIEDLSNKVLSVYKAEYKKGLKIKIDDSLDIQICYSDLTVWYHNHNCQNALPEIKKIWDSVQSNQLGSKSLHSFFTCLTDQLFYHHQKLTQYVKISKQLVRSMQNQYLQSTLGASSALEKAILQQKENSHEFFTHQSSYSFPKNVDVDPDSVYFSISLNFAEIGDLGSAFCEGFEGFSLKVKTSEDNFVTNPVDVNGNQAIWNSEFQFSLKPEEKTVEIELQEHLGSKTRKLAKISLDLFNYLMHIKDFDRLEQEDSSFYILGKEKYAIMDILDDTIEEAPKIAFNVSIACSKIEVFQEWVEQRTKYLKQSNSEIRQNIDAINIRLAQYTAGFKSIAFDENRIFTIAEQDSGFCCFSPKSEKKNRRSCLIY